jgi:hypothetical protein
LRSHKVIDEPETLAKRETDMVESEEKEREVIEPSVCLKVKRT